MNPFTFQLYPRGNWFLYSRYLLYVNPQGSWLPSSRCPYHICPWGPNSLFKVPFVCEVLILSFKTLCPRGPNFHIEVTLALEVLISSSRFPWLWCSNSLFKTPFPSMSWFPSWGAIDFKVLLSLRSWSSLWGTSCPQELSLSLKRPYIWSPHFASKPFLPSGSIPFLKHPSHRSPNSPVEADFGLAYSHSLF